MTKREKDRSMPSLKTFQTKSYDLTLALEKMLEKVRNIDFEGEKTFEITVREVVLDNSTSLYNGREVTVEQKRLLEIVDAVTHVKVDFDVDKFVSDDRQKIDGRRLKDKK